MRVWPYMLNLGLGIILWMMLLQSARSQVQRLDLQWQYCPGPTELVWQEIRTNCVPLKIPGSLPSGESLKIKGSDAALASYRAHLVWPEQKGNLGIRLSMVFGAYRLWLLRAKSEPILLFENGHYAIDTEQNRARIRDLVLPLNVQLQAGEVFEFMLEVASSRGSPILREAPLWGEFEAVQSYWIAVQTERAALMGGFFMILLYCLALFGQRPSDFANLWAGLLALVLLVRYVTTEWMLGQFLDEKQWSEVQNLMLMNMTTHLSIVCLSGFFFALFPNRFTRINFYFTAFIYLLVSSWSMYLGAQAFMQHVEGIMYLLMILHTPALLGIVTYLLWRRAQDVAWILGGALLLTLASLNDFLIYFWHWKGIYLTHYATLFYAFSQSLVTGRRFARTYQRNQDLLDEIKEKERARTLFFHNTSHELRTPLNGIIGFLRLLVSDRFGEQSPQARQQLEKCIRLAESLTLQVNTILDLAKSRRGSLQLLVSSFSLKELLRDAEYLAEGLMQRRGMASFEAQTQWERGAEASFCGDREKIATVLRNLLGNAFKFSDPARLNRVFLRVEQRASELVIEVKDGGIGIPEDQINRVFEEFSQLAADARRSYEGTGLGLAMVKDLVQLEPVKERREELEDWVSAEKAFLSATDARPLTLKAGESLQSYKILVVDDHELNCEVMQHILEHQGYQVIVAYGGREAIDLAKRERPDLILLDLMMPVYSGEDVLRDLRRDRDLQEIPVVLITARASDSDRVLGLSLGADDYLAKPIQTEELVFRVRNILQRLTLKGQGVRDEEQDRWIQMGRLLLELSHELKNIFHYGNHSGLKQDALRYLYRGMPLSSRGWEQAVEGLLAGKQDCRDPQLQHLALSGADPILVNLRQRVASLPVPAEGQQEVWEELRAMPEATRRFCLELLSLLRQHKILAEQVEMARELIAGILDLGRDEQRLRAELSQAWLSLESLFRARWLHLGIQVSVSQGIQTLPLSQSAFLQVCLNLLGNATDAVADLPKEQRWVELQVEETENVLKLRFSNGGAPLHAGRVQTIFEGESTDPGQRKSFGLAITRRIVQKAGGELSYSFEAEHPEFVVSFPRSKSS